MEIKVEDYGDMLAQVKNKPCVAFVMFGSYQGEWVAALDGGDTIELWKGYYGSCSGCDWIEWEKNYKKDTVSLEAAQEYFSEEHSFLDIPKATLREMTLETFEQIFPANIRKEISDFEPKELFEKIKIAAK